jgi:LemA protein
VSTVVTFIVLVSVGLLVMIVLAYNSLVRLRNIVDQAWSGVDVQLKRRHDLVPNLVESVRAYAEHERRVFRQVTQARVAAVSASGPADSAPAEQALGAALGRLVAVAEAYPQLRASENFRELQRELANTENQISASRRIYNANVQAYNSRIQSFPWLLLAAMARFHAREYFAIEDAAEREPVRVAFPSEA